MKPGNVDTAIILTGDRFMPPSAVAAQAKMLQDSGVVDYLEMGDQLVSFFPSKLWTPANAPLAKLIPDIDSCSDVFVMAAYCLAHAPKLKLTISTDSIRRGPAEFVQTMLTLANITGGNAMFQIGGGEVKQAKPYGWKRAEGLGRMEDLFKIFHALFEANEPIDFQGNYTTLTRASLGSAKQHRPVIWGLGGGPKLMDLVTTFCDGLSASAPSVWSTPDEAHEAISGIKAILKTKQRDPEKFGFGVYIPVLIHEDANAIDRALDNPLIRWFAATTGRVEPADFRKEGMEPAVPDGWTYFQKMLPHDTSAEFIAEVLGKTTRKMAERSFLYGTAAQVAEQIRPYIDAGVNWVMPFDCTSLTLQPDDAMKGLQRNIDVCAQLKGIG